MKPETWSQIRELFERALELPGVEREGFVARESRGSAEIRERVLRMLASDSQDTNFLEPPSRRNAVPFARAWHPAPGERIGAFTLEREIGSGGMGTVYAARQERPSRVVALKLMQSGLGSPDARRRFEVEAEILGRLRHPGIAAIHEAGLHRAPDGSEVPYFAMEQVEGARDVVAFAADERLDLRARVELVRSLCAAVHHAHQKGVIHRDLKPANVLVDSGGQPKVIDYGVARVTEPGFAAAVRTLTGHAFGTLQYMSPEQLGGSSEDLDTRADVYALGVILYELLARRTPHAVEGRAIAEVVAEICEREPAPPSRYAPNVPRELDWIALMALAKERERRYASAEALSEDLARYLRNEAVLAGPPTRAYRVAKFVARNRMLVVAGALLFASLVGGIVATTFAQRRAEQRRIEAENAKFATLAALGQAEQRRVEADTARTRADGEADKARTALRRQSAVIDALADLVRSVRPDQDGRQVTLYELLERRRSTLETDLAGDPALRAAMQDFFSTAYFGLGLLDTAGELMEDAIEALESFDDPDLAQRARLRRQLATMRMNQGRLDEAQRLTDAAVDDFEHAGDDASVSDLLYSLRTRALLLNSRRKMTEAIAAYRDLIPRADQVIADADDEPDEVRFELQVLVATVRAELAALIVDDHPEEAEALARDGRERAIRDLGADSPYAVILGMRLGRVLVSRGKYGEALPLLRETVAQLTSQFGATHSNTVQAQIDLVRALRATGEVDEAENTALEALAVCTSEHAGFLQLEVALRQALSDVYATQGRRAEESAQIRAILEAIERRGEPDDLLAVPSLTQLAELEMLEGRFESAAELAESAAKRALASLGPNSLALAKARAAWGRALHQLEKRDEAVAVLQRAFADLPAASGRADGVRKRIAGELLELRGTDASEAERAELQAALDQR